MVGKRHLIFALGLSGVAVVSILNMCAGHLRKRDDRLQRKALQRWEGEGGNVVSPAMPTTVDALSQDATP